MFRIIRRHYSLLRCIILLYSPCCPIRNKRLCHYRRCRSPHMYFVRVGAMVFSSFTFWRAVCCRCIQATESSEAELIMIKHRAATPRVDSLTNSSFCAGSTNTNTMRRSARFHYTQPAHNRAEDNRGTKNINSSLRCWCLLSSHNPLH